MKLSISRMIKVLLILTSLQGIAAKPVFIISAIKKAAPALGPGQTTTASYRVTNNTPFFLVNNGVYKLNKGATQIVTPSSCDFYFTLAPTESCILELLITSNEMTHSIIGGPVVCQNINNPIYCSAPNSNDSLHVELVSGIVLKISNSPLLLSTGGANGGLIIENTSSTLTITNIAADFTGTALEGKVTQDSSGCTSLGPQQTCTLLFFPGNDPVPLTNFPIQGEGTDQATAAIAIEESATAVLTLSGSPLILTANGSSGTITVMNTSHEITATNISANLSGTALAGLVTQDASNCVSLAPRQQCTLTFTPGSTAVNNTDFLIKGTNTLPTQGQIAVNGNNIVLTTNSPLELQKNGPAGSITITNTSGSLTALNITADISGTALAGKVTITGNTCASVIPGGNCQITFTPSSSSVTLTNFVIQGSNTNAVIAAVTVDLWMYVSTYNLATVLRCVVSGVTGGIGSCVATGSNLGSSVAVMIGPTGTYAYVSRFPLGQVVKCDIDSNGLLQSCAPTLNTPGPQYGAFHPNGTKIYIPNNYTSTVTLCDVLSNGNLTNCVVTGSGFSTPTMISLDLSLNLAYVTNSGNNTVSQCKIASDFTFVNCIQNSDPTFVSPTGINFDPMAANAYVTNNGTSSISRCDVTPTDGTLTNCNTTGAGFSGFGNLVINSENTFAYVSSLSPSGVNLCQIIGGGNISNTCTFFGVAGTPIYITLY